MKTKSKINLCGALFLTALFLMVSSCWAAPETTAPAKNQGIGPAIIVATVNIYETKIISQEGNVLKIGFDLNNRIGVQSGIKYGIELRSKDGKNLLLDRKIYSETITLGNAETVKREIEYTAPEYLQGKFDVFAVSQNESGLLLGNVSAGEVELTGTGKYIKINSEECVLKVVGRDTEQKIEQRMKLSSEEEITFNCPALNLGESEVIAFPFLETSSRSNFGPVILEEKGESIQFKAGEKKNVVLPVSKVQSPQIYVIKLTLQDDQGEAISNPIDFSYAISGTSATIENATFDKNDYFKGDTAFVTTFWMSQGKIIDQKTGEREKVALKVAIQKADGSECASAVESNGYGKMEITKVSIVEDCSKPKVTVSLTDEEGTILDEKVLGFQEEKISVPNQNQNQEQPEKPISTLLYLIAGGILLIGIVISLVIKKKQSGVVGMLALVFVSGMLMAKVARADTVTAGYGISGSGFTPLPFSGLNVPANAAVAAWSTLTYNYSQCSSAFTGTITVSHKDDSGSLVSYRPSYANIILSSGGTTENWADSSQSVSISKGNGSGNLTTYLRWKAYGMGGIGCSGVLPHWCDKENSSTSSFGYSTCGSSGGGGGGTTPPATGSGCGPINGSSCGPNEGDCPGVTGYNYCADGQYVSGSWSGAYAGWESYWLWKCTYAAPVWCYMNKTAPVYVPPSPVPGACNTSTTGKFFSSPPAAGIICSAGTATGVDNLEFKYGWQCVGSNGGDSPFCYANRCDSPNCISSDQLSCNPFSSSLFYSCDKSDVCVGDCDDRKENKCTVTGLNGCPGSISQNASVCRDHSVVDCEDFRECPCPSKNWIEVAP